MVINKDIVDDGDIIDIQAHKRDGDTTFVLTLSWRAANWQIILTEKEMKAMIRLSVDA